MNADGLLGQVGNIKSSNMFIYANNNPIIYVDPEGEFPVLALFVTSLFVLTTYALIKESRPIIDPIINNISISSTIGIGAEAEFLNTGFSSSSGNNGFECSRNGCGVIRDGTDFDFTFHSESSYYLNGHFIESKSTGFGPIRSVSSQGQKSIHLVFDFSITDPRSSQAMSVTLDFDIENIVKDYYDLITGVFK